MELDQFSYGFITHKTHEDVNKADDRDTAAMSEQRTADKPIYFYYFYSITSNCNFKYL